MRLRRRPAALTRPEQGWSSLLLMLGMLAVLGFSVADSRALMVGSASLTDSLPLLIVVAGLIGYLLARSSLGVVRAHVIGAGVAAALLLLTAGGALMAESPLPTSTGAFTDRIEQVWLRLDSDISRFMAEEITTPTVTTYLVLGAICWTTAQFSAFSVFRYDRGGPAVMAVGTLLFLNVGLGSLQPAVEPLPVVPVLAIFAALALLLLMRLQLVEQRFAWARRHISDASDVGRLFIRSGVAFVLIAVLSASSLTVWATVEAQEVNLDALEEPLEGFADEVSRLLGIFGVPPAAEVPPSLGRNTPLSTVWTPGTGVAFTAMVEQGSLRGNYWWGKADDYYDYENDRWQTTTSTRQVVPAGSSLVPERDARTGGPHQAWVYLVVGAGGARSDLYRLPDVDEISTHDVNARVTSGGEYGKLAFAEVLDEGDGVRFASSVRDYDGGPEGFTENDLRATADRQYPEWTELYLQGEEDRRLIGPKTREMADRIKDQYATPYDQAMAVQTELRGYAYEIDLGSRCDPFDGFPECLLTIKEGFCQQYATTMVMVMRAMGVPARFVTGYLPGVQQDDGSWVVEQQAFHNWVEVYFPDMGWVRFDPTPGLEGFSQVPTDPDPGETPEAPDSSPEPTLTFPPLESDAPEPSPEDVIPVVDGGASGSGPDSTILVIGLAGIAALLLGVVSLLLLFRLRRLPGGDDSLAYRGIVSLATRLGYGPHPSQTEYEYAGTLAETIPTVRDDLYLVTDARVQTAYSGRDPVDEQQGRLRGAYARIRTALLRLMLRRRR